MNLSATPPASAANKARSSASGALVPQKFGRIAALALLLAHGAFGAAPASAAPPLKANHDPDRATSQAVPRSSVHASVPCTQGQTAALTEVACDLMGALRKRRHTLPGEALVATADLALPQGVALPQRAKVTSLLLQVIAAHLPALTRLEEKASSLRHALTLARRSGLLLYLKPRITNTQLEVTAELYELKSNLWERALAPKSRLLWHGFAERKLDPELRSLLPKIPLVSRSWKRFATPETGVAALACDDLDGDGSSELVFTGRRRILRGRFSENRFKASRAIAWSELSPVASSPLREPLASVAITRAPRESAMAPQPKLLSVALSDRALSLRLNSELKPLEKQIQGSPWTPTTCLKRSAHFWNPKPQACSAGDPSPIDPGFGEPLDAVAAHFMLGRQGQHRKIYAAHLPKTGTIELRDDLHHHALVVDAGAQIALGDLDGDGLPELVTSAPGYDPQHDELRVHTWFEDGNVRRRFQTAINEGIRAIAVCPHETLQPAPIIVAGDRHLWVSR